jgi:hypothetical protein
LLSQLLRADSRNVLLLSAPSNSAADNLIVRLIKAGTPK